MARVGFIVSGAVLLVIGVILTALILFFYIGLPLIFIGLILLIIGAVTSTQKQKMRMAAVGSGAYNQSLNDLNDKLMKGEITKSEYKRMKKTIMK